MPAAVAVLSLLILVWAGYWMIRTPYLGADTGWGVFATVDPAGPAGGLVSVGERWLNPQGYAFLNPGDNLVLEVQAPSGAIRTVRVTLDAPNKLPVLLERLSPLVFALVFWLGGVTVVALSRKLPRSGFLYFALCQLIVVYIALVLTGDYSFRWLISYLDVIGNSLGIVAIHLHLHFPERLPMGRLGRIALWIGYVAVAVANVTLLLSPIGHQYSDFRFQGDRYWLIGSLAMVVILLVAKLTRRLEAGAALQSRLVAATAIAGFAPALIFTMLPDMLNQSQYAAPSALTFAFMSIVPLGYTYAILRYRLIQYEGTVTRAFGYLVTILLMAMALMVGALGLRVTGLGLEAPVFVGGLAALAVALAVGFEPIRRRIQRGVDRVFYGRYEELRTTLRGVDETLARVSEVEAWAEALCRQFATALEVKPVGLLVRTADGRAFRLAVHDAAGATAALPVELEATTGLIEQLEARSEPCTLRDLRATRSRGALTVAERGWLVQDVFELCWPIRAHGALQAVLLLGPKPAGYAADEVELIALTSRQIGVMLENAQYARELEQLSRASLRTRDEERRRVSRDLHDHIIQPLVSLNFTLAAARDVPQAAEAREQVSELITHVRRISADLRPPALDEVGLAAAGRGLVRTFGRTSGLSVEYTVRPDEDAEVPEPVASTLYAALRESLSNIQKHAQATRVTVLLDVEAERVVLVVHDDGVGFSPPTRLGQLAPAGHFGLLGLSERLSALGGSLAVQAQPGQGTRLECSAPLRPL